MSRKKRETLFSTITLVFLKQILLFFLPVEIGMCTVQFINYWLDDLINAPHRVNAVLIHRVNFFKIKYAEFRKYNLIKPVGM